MSDKPPEALPVESEEYRMPRATFEERMHHALNAPPMPPREKKEKRNPAERKESPTRH